jgi:hypothetical protein
VSLLCLAVWLPATQHCQLEKLPGLDFLRCATDTPADSDCRGDSCEVVERGAYKVPESGDMVVIPPCLEMLFEIDEILPEAAFRPKRPSEYSDTSISQRPDSWQCYSSRALAIRGPSLPS